MYSILKPGQVLLDYGPTTMIISARRKGIPYTKAAMAGAKKAVTLVEELSGALHLARKTITTLETQQLDFCPDVLLQMLAGVKAIQEGDFTPLAAVAGTFSDMVLARVMAHGADEVIVNNGGDISFQLPSTSPPLKVGVAADRGMGRISHILTLPLGMGSGGIATSGYGGRSLTKGVASAVTVIASTGSKADAAATAIANATNCDDKAITRCRAEELDPFTDISGQLVTMSVGQLLDVKATEAIICGLNRTKELFKMGVIAGVVIFVQGMYSFWPRSLRLMESPDAQGAMKHVGGENKKNESI